MSASPPASDETLFGERLATKVFGVGELAEMILLNLPMKDLLFAQLICRDIKHTIDSSTLIQRALFFLPGEASSAHFESKDMPARWNWLHDGKDCELPSEGDIKVNPLLCRYRCAKPQSSGPFWEVFTFSRRALNAICGVARGAERGGRMQVVPSCAKMYLTQPPIPITVDSAVSSDEVDIIPHVVLPRGSSLGTLMEESRIHGKRPRCTLIQNVPTCNDHSPIGQLCLGIVHIWLWFKKFEKP
ncbi:hypothetical protein KC333_g6313 [Hortaea werneckii]|nr:hypothetical protein KC333_g6313 [Hortaea werneckii]KAI7311402.1 hypothetical protein KC326_g6308 [Hortaea werneckii]